MPSSWWLMFVRTSQWYKLGVCKINRFFCFKINSICLEGSEDKIRVSTSPPIWTNCSFSISMACIIWSERSITLLSRQRRTFSAFCITTSSSSLIVPTAGQNLNFFNEFWRSFGTQSDSFDGLWIKSDYTGDDDVDVDEYVDGELQETEEHGWVSCSIASIGSWDSYSGIPTTSITDCDAYLFN